MNRKRLLAIADEIERRDKFPKVTFDMAMDIQIPNKDTYTLTRVGDKLECGAACCVAGYACLMFGQKGRLVSCRHAQELLELTNEEADGLFYNQYANPYGEVEFEKITASLAAETLRRVAKEGWGDDDA